MQSKVKSAYPWLCWLRNRRYNIPQLKKKKKILYCVLRVASDLFPCRQKRIRDNQSLPSAYLDHSTNERPWALWKIPILLGGHLLNSYGPLTHVLKCSGMPGPSSTKSCFCRWKNCNPCSVKMNWLYRSNYILPNTWRQISSQILGSNAPNSLLASSMLYFHCLFWGWKINTSLSKCTVVWVYSITGMIESVKIVPGAKIVSLGIKR